MFIYLLNGGRLFMAVVWDGWYQSRKDPKSDNEGGEGTGRAELSVSSTGEDRAVGTLGSRRACPSPSLLQFQVTKNKPGFCSLVQC